MFAALVCAPHSANAYQRLCKTVEPDIGATVEDYDAAGSTGRAYTADGLPLTVVSNGSTWTYGYNRRRLLISESLAFPGGGNWSVSRSYDANASASAMSYPDGTSVAFSPNALGEPTQVGGYATNVSHHPNGAVAGYTLGNGIVHSLTQNTRGLPLVNRDAGVLQDQYAFDANGNVSSITDQQEGITSRSLGYDGLDRLTAANAPNVWGNASYGYDGLDNLRSSTVGGRGISHGYDAANRLTSLTVNGAVIGYAYDSRGNITGKGAQGYYFDQGNRMQLANGIASYAYDGLGRRVLANGANGTNTYQLYSQDGQLLIRQPIGGGANNSYTLYLYLGGKAIAEHNSASGVTYLHTDALGSPVAKTNAAGALLSRTRYEPYGNTAAGTTPTAIGFTGHANDAETGLVYMQQRYYDPIAGRFLSVDPVVTNWDFGESFNRYVYAQSNPYRYTDPDGRNPVAIAAAAAAGCARSGACVTAVAATAAAAGQAVSNGASAIGQAISRIFNQADSGSGQQSGDRGAEVKSPEIKPSDVAGKTAGEIGKLATDAGLTPKGSDPVGGKGSFVDPKTGEQRVLVHGDHAHVNDAAGNRLDVNGNKVPANSPEAHLPVKPDPLRKVD